jgi:hypothetical protein
MSNRRRKLPAIGTKRHALSFFLIYIVGAVILTFEKSLIYRIFDETSFKIIGNAIIIFSAIMLMSVYVFFVTMVPATKLRTDVAADNVYYLGFLYTLTSLAIALSVDEPDAILANFGVAIVSTLIGIAARVGLNQLRIDPTDIEEASRLELADATRKVRTELEETVRQLVDFRNLSLQVLAEGYEEVQKNVDSISHNILSSVQELVQESAKPLQELVEKTKTANDEAVNSIATVTKSNKALAKSNEDMIAKLEAVNSALDGLSNHYGDTGIIDDKIIRSVHEQLMRVQNQLTEQARNEFSGLKISVDEVGKRSQELKFEIEKSMRPLGAPSIDLPRHENVSRPTLRASRSENNSSTDVQNKNNNTMAEVNNAIKSASDEE